MIELYRGSINTWECDEMGHMNVRFYVAKMMEGLSELSHHIQLSGAFREGARTILRPRDQHIRFIKEAHAGAPFLMTGCVLAVHETSALIYQQIDHADGRPCASFRTWVDHADPGSGRAVAWPEATYSSLMGLCGEAPAQLGPRSIDVSLPPRRSARLADALTAGAPVIGRGVVLPHQVDLTGFMLPEMFIGRISDSIGHLLRPWRERMTEQAAARGERLRLGGAVLEYRLVYRRWPRCGDRFVIHTGGGFQSEKTHAFIHWLIDPETGDAWCTTEAVAISLNLDTRKIVPATQDLHASLANLAPKGLTI